MVPLHQQTFCKGSRPWSFPLVLWQILQIGSPSPNEMELNEHDTGSIAGL